MKKSWLICIFMISILLIAGCSSSNGSKEASTEAAEKKVDFPTKPATLIVPYSAGGGTDAVGRAIASAAEEHLGQSIGVVNKTGGGGAVGMSEGANSKPDGYTMTMITAEVTMLPHLGLTPITYKDFKPIAQFNFDPSSLVVPADSPYNTIDDFLNDAKAKPGKIRIGNGGTGAAGHLSAVAMGDAVGAEFSHVPFDGGAPAVTAVLGGHVEAVVVQPPEVLAQVKAGKLKILGIMAKDRLDILPDVPTFKEAGYDFGEIGVWRGVTVPKDTPDEVVAILTDAFTKAAEEPKFKEFMENNGLGLVIKDAKDFEQLMADSHELYGELIPRLGLGKN
ncbi:tripartite tricarboxylate transporter substrate binding protein [Bacillus sp. es.034]|uniref:tripartite tricarboxylate transporter substrate binding protein n=1 Tax=Bacillus sp. es.034 TaxID=1761763 RepID=UPI000C00CC9B|nr:tripartite tricarboxylate transporter substrate binding protein [Bacillus sp. es.034]PFG06790.1 tripartite-type tricarboxylate transporter receptor subunit TctC [Bacillus sp. es.034]